MTHMSDLSSQGSHISEKVQGKLKKKKDKTALSLTHLTDKNFTPKYFSLQFQKRIICKSQ